MCSFQRAGAAIGRHFIKKVHYQSLELDGITSLVIMCDSTLLVAASAFPLNTPAALNNFVFKLILMNTKYIDNKQLL